MVHFATRLKVRFGNQLAFQVRLINRFCNVGIGSQYWTFDGGVSFDVERGGVGEIPDDIFHRTRNVLVFYVPSKRRTRWNVDNQGLAGSGSKT